MDKITYIFPSRSRSIKFFEALENIKELSASDNFEVIGVFDLDDKEMNNDEVIDRFIQYPFLKPFFGNSIGKINAINRELSKISNDTSIICLHSDDMVFIKQGLDLDIREAFKNYSGLVHFPDQYTKARLITYSMMSKDYFDVDNFIYHPDFESVYADNFQMDLAKKRGLYKFVDKQILEHRHPYWGYGEKDALLIEQESTEIYTKDRATYIRLKKEFGIV